MTKTIKISKIELITNKEEKIIIESSKIEKFFQMSKINPRNPIKTLRLKGLNKITLSLILIKALMRKILKLKPAILEKEIIKIVLGKVKSFKKINYVHLWIKNKEISFDLREIHLLNLLGDLRGVILNNQYSLNEKNIQNKIVIDAGSHNGEFSLLAVLMGAKKVYAFEPVSKTAEILNKNIIKSNMQNRIELVKQALGDKNYLTNISFDFIGDGGAKIGLTDKNKNSEKIKVIKLDDFVKNNKISNIGFIKMDIEGFEENALLGAKETIKRDKPILSLSAYHKPSDKKRLPKIIKSIRKDYKIILNSFDEEDFYCS